MTIRTAKGLLDLRTKYTGLEHYPDNHGTPLRPAILWADTRSSAMLSQYHGLNSEMRYQLANPIAAGMAGSSLLWLQKHESKIYATARWVLQPKDWLRLRLTQQVAAEPIDASGTLLYDVGSDCWAVDVIEALNLRSDWLPKLLPSSSSIAGNLTPKAAEYLGLPSNIPVVAGAADTAAAILGNNLKPGTVQLTVGSAAQIVTLRSQPVVDPQLVTFISCSTSRSMVRPSSNSKCGNSLRMGEKSLGLHLAASLC